MQKLPFVLKETDYVLREAFPDDFKEMESVINESYWSYQKSFFTDTPTSRKRIDFMEIAALYRNQNLQLFVLSDKNAKVLGAICVSLPPHETYAKFELFALDASVRGQNKGSEVINFVEEWVRSHDRLTLKIEVFTFADKLANYYQALGYEFNGIEKEFFHSDCIREEYQNPHGQYLQEMEKTLPAD